MIFLVLLFSLLSVTSLFLSAVTVIVWLQLVQSSRLLRQRDGRCCEEREIVEAELRPDVGVGGGDGDSYQVVGQVTHKVFFADLPGHGCVIADEILLASREWRRREGHIGFPAASHQGPPRTRA
jgi:hypothetical protein